MVFGEPENVDGGQYGSIAPIPDASTPGRSTGMKKAQNGGAMTLHKHTASTSSSSSSMIEDEESSYYSHDNMYQRQPLLNGNPPLTNSDGMYKENGNYYGGGSDNAVKINMPTPLRDETRFPKEKLKTFLAFLFLFISWVITTASLALTHERVPKYSPLPDAILDNVNAQKWGLNASEIIIILSVYSCILVIFFHKHRFIIYRRIFLIMGLLYFYRSITMYVTVLPVADPTYYCSPKQNDTASFVLVAKRVAQLLSGFGLAINGKHTFCGDYIFSGHTVCLVIAYLIVKEYTPRRWWLLHWLFALLAALGVVFVLIGRGHYTVDCVLAYYITTRLFYIYHTMANNESLKTYGPTNFFERLWWFPLFRYFEKNVHGVVPRHYEWPFPWPRRWCSKRSQRTS